MSLPNGRPSGYFSSAWATLRLAAAVVMMTACGQRDRLTFPTENPGNGSGPITEIFDPDGPDTTVAAGDLVFIAGRSRDPDGVDTVYFQLGGLGQSFAPLNGNGADTVRFGLPLSTEGRAGTTATVQIYAVDQVGDRGLTATRQIHIR